MYYTAEDLLNPVKKRVCDLIDTGIGIGQAVLHVEPCKFAAPEEALATLATSENLGELVRNILEYSMLYDTLAAPRYSIETTKRRKRSALDIWRLASPIMPNVTLFDVMNVLTGDKDLYFSWFCGTVRKRVFQTREKFKLWKYDLKDDTAWMSTEYPDEFGLVMAEWESFHE